MIRDIVIYPDRRLKQPCRPVTAFGPALRRLTHDLEETARSFPYTTGIAAPQVGELWRACFIDCTDHPRVPDAHGPLVLINPVLTHYAGDDVGREGCLSLPEITANVQRGTEIGVHFYDVAGKETDVRLTGFEARVVLHEMDHLDGILILDRVRSLALDVFPRRRRPGTSGT
ncbi:MAG: peptide deformylase [Thermoleophilia bacterium]|nr:peptide deformylase [Thermoleophilia bacterium]